MPESVPNYLTIDPATGSVGALFSGGVQLNESQFVGPSRADASVRWIRKTDGSVIADIFAFEGGSGHFSSIESHSTADKQATDLILSADNLTAGNQRSATIDLAVGTVSNWTGAPETGIKVECQRNGGSGGRGGPAMLIDSNGNSTYPRLSGNNTAYLQMAFALISAAGAFVWSAPSGLTVVRNGVGNYSISGLNPASSGAGWTPHVMPVNIGTVGCAVYSAASSSCQYELFNSTNGTALDWEHSVIIWAP